MYTHVHVMKGATPPPPHPPNFKIGFDTQQAKDILIKSFF